jgi:hypothetical protein
VIISNIYLDSKILGFGKKEGGPSYRESIPFHFSLINGTLQREHSGGFARSIQKLDNGAWINQVLIGLQFKIKCLIE